MATIKPMEVAEQTAQAIFTGIVKCGAAPDLLLECAELTLAELEHDSTDKHLKLWKAGEVLLQMPDIALTVGSRSSPLERGVMGGVFCSSKNLKIALVNATKYISILVDYIDFTVTEDGMNTVVTYSYTSTSSCFHRYGLEHMSAAFVNWVRVFLGQRVSPVSLSYQFSEPPSLDAYAMLFDCPVYFEQPANKIVLSNRLLSLQKSEYSTYLYKLVSDHADNLLKKKSSTFSFLDHVRSIINNRLYNGNFTAEDIALSLNLSKRTYQRRLSKQGYNHQSIVDEVRKQLAYSYLVRSDCQLKKIPYMLGYADFSGFSRAFKRWSGLTPKEYRLRQ